MEKKMETTRMGLYRVYIKSVDPIISLHNP